RYTLENVDESQLPYYVQKSQKINDMRFFLGGNASMYPIGPWVYSSVNNLEKFPHDFKTVIRPMPAWKDNSAGRSRSAAGVLTINKLSDHKEEAYKFARFMTGEGAVLMGNIPSSRDIDMTEVVKLLVGDLDKATDLWDVDSVIETFNSDMTLVARDVFPEEESEIREIYYQAQEKYLVGGASLDEVVEEMIKKADKVMKEE
ncbi:MAG: extracellular solute-binding protein, partial [bacterium]